MMTLWRAFGETVRNLMAAVADLTVTVTQINSKLRHEAQLDDEAPGAANGERPELAGAGGRAATASRRK